MTVAVSPVSRAVIGQHGVRLDLGHHRGDQGIVDKVGRGLIQVRGGRETERQRPKCDYGDQDG